MIASRRFPDVPFLLNAPLLENLTLPNFDAANNTHRRRTRAPSSTATAARRSKTCSAPLGSGHRRGLQPRRRGRLQLPAEARQQHLSVRRPVDRAARQPQLHLRHRQPAHGTEQHPAAKLPPAPQLSGRAASRRPARADSRSRTTSSTPSTLAAASAAERLLPDADDGQRLGHQPALLPARLLRAGRVARAPEPLALARPALRVQHARARGARPHRGHLQRRRARARPRPRDLRRRARAHLRPRPQQLLAARRPRLRAALVRRAGRDAHPRRLRPLQRLRSSARSSASRATSSRPSSR